MAILNIMAILQYYGNIVLKLFYAPYLLYSKLCIFSIL